MRRGGDGVINMRWLVSMFISLDYIRGGVVRSNVIASVGDGSSGVIRIAAGSWDIMMR
jgi:hypothetical protein